MQSTTHAAVTLTIVQYLMVKDAAAAQRAEAYTYDNGSLAARYYADHNYRTKVDAAARELAGEDQRLACDILRAAMVAEGTLQPCTR